MIYTNILCTHYTYGVELTLGVKLGEGAFCDVKEISAIVLKRRNDVSDANGTNTTKKLGATVILPKHVPSTRPKNKHNSNDNDVDVDEADFPTIFQDKNAIREYMSENCMRDNENDDNDEDNNQGARLASSRETTGCRRPRAAAAVRVCRRSRGVRGGGRDGRHGLDVLPGVLDPLLARDHPRKVDVGPVGLGPDASRGAQLQGLGEAVQYPAEHHVLQGLDGPFAVVHLIELLKGLQKVGVGGVVIALLAVEGTRHRIDGRLKRRGDVDGVGAGSGGREGRLGLGHPAEAVVDLGLDEVGFHQELLVIELLELNEQVVDEGEGVGHGGDQVVVGRGRGRGHALP